MSSFEISQLREPMLCRRVLVFPPTTWCWVNRDGSQIRISLVKHGHLFIRGTRMLSLLKLTSSAPMFLPFIAWNRY